MGARDRGRGGVGRETSRGEGKREGLAVFTGRGEEEGVVGRGC